MEWNVTLHQILSRIICRNNGLISNQGKGQSGYTPSHIRSRRSPVALMLADSIRHWYEKKEKIKERKKKEEKKSIKKNRRIVFRLSSGLLLTRTRGLKWKIGTKGMVDRARGRVSKIRESLEFVCRAIQCTLGNEYEFLTSPRNNEASEQKCRGLLVHLS